MASKVKLSDRQMKKLLKVDIHDLFHLENDDLNHIHKRLYEQGIITKDNYYLLIGLDLNIRK